MKVHSKRAQDAGVSPEGTLKGKAPDHTGQNAIGNEAIQDLVKSSGGGKPLEPSVLDKMEQAFGADLSDVRIHEGASAETIGAEALTHGNEIHFASGQYSPESTKGEEILAHEIAHVIQQRKGQVDNPAGVDGGLNEDEGLENEANQVAARVAAGKEAGLNGGEKPKSFSSAPAQRYTEYPRDNSRFEWMADIDLRVSDDGNIAVGVQGAYGSHEMWARPGMVSEANSILERNNSVIRLHTGSDYLFGMAPDGSGYRVLVKVEAENVANETMGDEMKLWADCGRSARDVMGAEGDFRAMTALYGEEGSTRNFNPGSMRDEAYRDLLPGGEREYRAMSEEDRDAFDREHGLNRYAAPEIGEGFTIATGGNNFEGVRTWNFHWAGIVLVSGGDRVALENYAVGDYDAENSDWEFQMYGPANKPGQTFHEQHKNMRQHGDAPTTLRVRKRDYQGE